MSERGTLTKAQQSILLAPIQTWRVHHLDGHSHLPAWDVAAHLTRVFGFEGWEKKILDLELLYEHVGNREKNGKMVPACSVGYRCTMVLTIRDADGNVVRQIEDAATGTATNQRDLGDAHDLAIKSAVSYALKRCAKDLGDQFGLSLYNGGSQNAVVGRVWAYADETDTELAEVEVHGDGIDEGDAGFGDKRGEGEAAPPEAPAPVREPEPAKAKAEKPEATPPAEKPEAPKISNGQLAGWQAEIEAATEVHGDGEPRSVKAIWKSIADLGALDVLVLDAESEKRFTLRELMVRRVNRIEAEEASA